MMRILNEQGAEITEQDADLTVGYIREETIIRQDAQPVDDVNKFAYADEDYETVRRYIRIPDEEIRARKIETLKRKLSDSDYCAAKIAEGSATAEEYAELIARRRAWRAEINELEGE